MDRNDDVIELGTASELTQGATGFPIDEALGQLVAGLSND
jgi:hypothetical protein